MNIEKTPLPLRVLALLLPDQLREVAIGDALEEYARREQKYGRMRALVWSWRQTFSLDLFRLRRELSSGHEYLSLPKRRKILIDRTTLWQFVRRLQQRPLFSVTVIAILALGIGATTAVFSVVNGLLLSPLPFPEADRLVRISKNDMHRGWSHYPVLDRELDVWRESSASFTGIAALRYTGAYDGTVTVDGSHRTVKILDVTTNYFDVLGVPAFLGPTRDTWMMGSPSSS